MNQLSAKQVLWLMTNWSDVKRSDNQITLSLKPEITTPESADFFNYAIREVVGETRGGACQIEDRIVFEGEDGYPMGHLGHPYYAVTIAGLSSQDIISFESDCADKWR
jgi:hypothetical protein